VEGSEVWREVHAACYGRGGGAAAAVADTQPSDAACCAPAASADSVAGSIGGTLCHFVQLSTTGASEHSPIPYFSAHGEADKSLLEVFNRLPGCVEGSSSSSSATDEEEDDDEIAPLKARRKCQGGVFCDNSRVTIWRPGLLHRGTGNARLAERLLSMVVPSVHTQRLADLMLEDVVSSLTDQRAPHETGPMRVINASQIAVWARMNSGAAGK
jgi:hypothetical protein